MKTISNAISHLSSSTSQLFVATLFLSFRAQVINKNDKDDLGKNLDFSEARQIDEALLRENGDIAGWKTKYNVSRFGCGI